MKKPERLVGYLDYNEIEFPFEFIEKSFSILLYPPTKEVWKEYSSIEKIFGSVNRDTRKHEWILQKEIEGTTCEGYHIIFNVSDISSNYQGFLGFDVNWYMCNSFDLSPDRIDGFSISGHDVNLFYPPQIVFESQFEFNENMETLEKISVSSTKQQTQSCGRYEVSLNIDASVEVTAYASYHSNSWQNPIDSNSKMITTFSVPVGIETTINAYYNLRQFFNYITYRKNIDIGNLDLFYINENGSRDYSGIIVFRRNQEIETHEKLKNRIIKYELLSQYSSEIFSTIKNGMLSFQHLCSSLEDMRHYPSSRTIMIFAAFEREFSNIYGKDKGRSEEYLEVKEKVISLIDTYQSTLQGKQLRHVKQLKNYVNNRDNSFQDNIKIALNDCEQIMSPFVKMKYPGSYSEAIDGISSRMGEVRNGIAHSKLDLVFDAIHLSDIKIIEELLYCIRLKISYIPYNDIKKCINDLFGEHMAFTTINNKSN